MRTAFNLYKMKKMKNYFNIKILSLGFLLISFHSCKKGIDSPGDGPTYTITGRLFQDCNMQPVANQQVDLFQEYSTGVGGLNGGILAATTTDANGNFTFDFKDMDGFTESIRIPAGQGYTKLIENIPQNQSISNMEVYKTIYTNFQVYLNVFNPHPNTDTLVIANFETNTEMRIPCPLSSGILYTATNYQLLNVAYGDNNYKRITWYFNQYNGTLYEKTFKIDKFCNDTVFTTIEIN